MQASRLAPIQISPLPPTDTRAARPSPAGRPEVRTPADVDLSSVARRLHETQGWMRSLLSALEEPFAGDDDPRWEEAGRDDYLASISDSTDPSPEATADRILGGIRGYIYRAFARSRPELTAEDLDTFEREARKGLERGLAQAGDLLEALGALSPDLRTSIDETADRVRTGLDTFLATERRALAR